METQAWARLRSTASSATLQSIYRLPLRLRRHALYILFHHRLGRFRRPKTFSEKINWRILNDRRPLIAWTCDKLETKQFGERHGVGSPVTLWSGTDVRELVGQELPARWVLKPNHRTGIVHFGTGTVPDISSLPPAYEDWLSDPQSAQKGEWAYSEAKRCLIVEEMLGDSLTPPADYKFFVFNGRAAAVQVDVNRFNGHTRRLYTPDWEPIQARITYPLGPVVPPPDGLVSLVSTAEKLGADFDFIRVDLYLVGEKVFLGEMTPYAIGGIEPFDPPSVDAWLGSFWTLPDVSQ